MKTAPACLLGLFTLLAGAAPPATAQTTTTQQLQAGLDSALNGVLTLPLPRALGPLITLANNADKLAIAWLEIRVNVLHKQLLRQQLSCGSNFQCANRLERQIRLLQRLKSKLSKIKRNRAREERKRKESGRDPFAGRLATLSGGPIAVPGFNTFVLVMDGLGDMPGDDPVGPSVSLVTPYHAGNEDFTVNLLALRADVDLIPTPNPMIFDVVVRGLGADFASYDVAPGMPTGVNLADLNPHGSPSIGFYDRGTSELNLFIEGMITNNFYSPSNPILWFATIFGVVDEAAGVAHVVCDDPMIAPILGPGAPLNQPSLMGAHILDFDAARGELHLLENTVQVPGADIAMVLWGDGSYHVDPAQDPALGWQISVDPMAFRGRTRPGVYAFADTAIRIDTGGLTYSGRLTNCLWNVNAGSFMADFRWVAPPPVTLSTAVGQLLTTTDNILFQIAEGPAVYDLVVMTNEFTTSGRLEIPELFFFGVPPGQGLVEVTGAGCLDGGPPATGSIMRMTIDGSPEVGQPVSIGSEFSPTNLFPQFLALGTSNSSWLGIPLPLPLDPLGAPGCSIYNDQGMVFPMPNPGGGGAVTLPIPPDPQLMGLELHWQGLVIAPSANSLGLATSELLTTTIK